MTSTLRFALLGIGLALAGCTSSGGGYTHYGTDDIGTGNRDGGPSGDIGATSHDLAGGASCGDGVKDGQETDVDCGGPVCLPCQNGRQCLTSTDCVGRQCTNGICMAAASCNDGVKDGTETDVDCGGGNCPPCSIGKRCSQNSDCTTDACRNTVCVDACSDGIQDGLETDVDCGGGTCPACANGKGCSVASDCTSANCTTGVCCSFGTANCDGVKFNGCNIVLSNNAQHCGSCNNACGGGQGCVNGNCQIAQPVMVGSYSVLAGPAWANMPPTYSCVDVCAMKFGGVAANYGCSTSAAVLNHMATVICYGVTGCQVKGDTYKLGATYIMGACSAYISDGNCAAATNYCWR